MISMIDPGYAGYAGARAGGITPVMESKEVMAVRTKRKKNGFTLVEVMIVVSIIAMLLAIAMPSFVKTRDSARTNSCLANLKAVEWAKVQWAMEYRKYDGDTVAWGDIAPTYMKASVNCPWGFAYTLQPVGTPPYCPVVGHH